VTDPNGGLGEEPLTRRLPLRNSADTTQATARPAGEPWRGGELDEDNPFAGTALGSMPERTAQTPAANSAVNPFGSPAPGSPSALPLSDYEDRRARTSFPITIGLICATAGATLGVTEVLARTGAAVAAFGILLSIIGLFSARKDHVGGRLVAVLAILIGLFAVGIAVVDNAGTFTWLNPDLPKHLADRIHDYVPFLA